MGNPTDNFEESSCSQCAVGKFADQEQSSACNDCSIFGFSPPFFAPEVRSSCSPWYESWLALGVEAGVVLLIIIIITCICCAKRRKSMIAAKRAKLSHKLLALRDYDSESAPDRGSFAENRPGSSTDDDDDTAPFTQEEWERRENLGEIWYYNKRTHAATLERPDGYASDDGNDIPDAPTTDETTTPESPSKRNVIVTVTLKYEFKAAADDEQQLSASQSEKVTLIQKFDDGWWKVRNAKGKEGLVPASYCHMVTNKFSEDDDDVLTL